MNTIEYVGTWEEIVANSAQLAGQRVRVTVLPASEPAPQDGPPSARPIWEEFAEVTAAIPQAELEKLPADASARIDHYLYGASAIT